MEHEDVPVIMFSVFVLFVILLLFGMVLGSPSDNRECVAWETSREWVTEAKPMMSTGSGMGMGLDGSFGPSISSNAPVGSITMGYSGKYEDVERCTEWVTPTP